MTNAVSAAVVRQSVRHAWIVALVAVMLGGLAAWFDIHHFAMDSRTENLVSPNAAWRAQEERFDAAFPQLNGLIVVVVDGASPERADEAAAALAARIAPLTQFFESVRRPDANAFFAHDGLLLLPTKDVQATTAQLIKAQPFLGALAADPSLRGLLSSLDTILMGVRAGQAQLSQLAGPLGVLTSALTDVEAGKNAYPSWRAMVTGAHPSILETRRFIEVKPKLDYSDLTPGVRASDAIRQAVAQLKLTPNNGVRVRLTGPVPMSDEEFATLAQHAGLLATLILCGMTAMLWLAVRSFRMITAIFISLLIGLSITAAAGLMFLGPFNVISVAFIPLFVGLGVDFGIQFCVRYRAERHQGGDLDGALVRAGGTIGGVLTLAAAAIAAGFYSFAPTDYAGLAKLGLIAGSGMLVTFALSLTYLPALLSLVRPGSEAAEIGFTWLTPLDALITRHHKAILLWALGFGVAGLVLLLGLRFDFNPLDLRSAKTESVSTALDLMKNPQTSPNTIDVIAPNRAAAQALAARLSRLPQVDHVMSIDTFVPQDQDAKLAAITDASFVLGPAVDPLVVAPPPSDSELVTSLLKTAQSLTQTAAGSHDPEAPKALQFAAMLTTLARGPASLRAKANATLVPGLKTMLAQMSGVLQASKVNFAMLPPDLVRDWVTKNGRYRLEVAPKGDVSSNAALARFTQAVRSVAPDATGTPIVIQESGRTIVNAFIKAGVLSFVAISILLFAWFRRLREVIFALAPLLLAFILTLATSVAVAMPLNFANIIALPLLLGIGVAFDVYFVTAWRGDARQLLQSPLGRAVILSAATTACGFGTLWFSSHPGTASMGALLLISLFWILAVVLILLPALLTRFTHDT
jgi:hopanoid biosynthesis associated RND transporter like protein HpnN